MTSLETCQLEPFVSEVTPQLEDPSSIELFQQQIEGYLQRMLSTVCRDLILASRPYQPPLLVASQVIDVPPIGSKGSVVLEVDAPDAPLGSHILSWAPLTDGSSIEDLQVTMFVPRDFIISISLQNPTAGVINPTPIRFQIVFSPGAEDDITL